MAKVLIIDHDVHLAAILSSYLSGQGFKVFAADSGEEGLNQATRIQPDVILMGAMFPDATGFQMCNRIRQNATTQSTPIIMMSQFAHLPNQQKYAMERGANEVVPKPLKVFELGELVDKYVGFSIARGTYKPESSPESIPTPRDKYTLATDIHRHLSDWLGKALGPDQKSKD